MGAGNVKLAYAHWADLPDKAFRVLVYMALVSRDQDDPPTFYAGREALALALGRIVREASDETAAERNAAFKAVREVTRVLVRRGTVRVLKPAAPGRNTVYALNLDRITGHGQRAPSMASTGHGSRTPSDAERGTVAGHDGARSASQRGTVTRGSGHGNRPPEEEEEDRGLTTGPISADLRNARSGSRAAGHGDDEDQTSTPGTASALRAPPDSTDDPDGDAFDVTTDEGTDAARRAAAARLDTWIAEHGHDGAA